MRLLSCLACALFVPGLAWAHDPGLSTATIRLNPDAVELSIELSERDATLLATEGGETDRRDGSDSQAAAAGQRVGTLWTLEAAGRQITSEFLRVNTAAGGARLIHLRYPRPRVALTADAVMLARLPPGHRQYVTLQQGDGTIVRHELLSGRRSTVILPAPAGRAERPAASALAFVRLGVEHIWTGYDHLLFLFGLLCVCRRIRPILVIISCFTAAHSLSLAAATLGWVSLPARLVEPAIALSIVAVGVENLIRRGEVRDGSRAALTFGFGLVHGLGFATALRDAGVGEGGAAVLGPLLGFNLGVEAGQLAAAAVVLPVLWRLQRNDRFIRVGLPVLSGVVIGLGGWWLVQRAVT